MSLRISKAMSCDNTWDMYICVNVNSPRATAKATIINPPVMRAEVALSRSLCTTVRSNPNRSAAMVCTLAGKPRMTLLVVLLTMVSIIFWISCGTASCAPVAMSKAARAMAAVFLYRPIYPIARLSDLLLPFLRCLRFPDVICMMVLQLI